MDAKTKQAIKDLPSSSKQFAAAYKRAKDGIGKLDSLKDDKKKLVAEAVKEAEKAEKERDDQAKKLESAGKDYAKTQKQRDDAVKEADRAAYEARRTTSYESQRSAERRRDAALRRVRELNRTLARQEAEGKKIRKEWLTASKDATAKRTAANKLAQDVQKVAAGMPTSYGWLPPAVDGVCTPDATLAKHPTKPGKATQPDSSYLVPEKPKAEPPKQGPPLATRLADAEAADKLQLAKICMSSKDAKMKARARELFEEILNKYGNTTSAVEAKQLLDTLPADK